MIQDKACRIQDFTCNDFKPLKLKLGHIQAFAALHFLQHFLHGKMLLYKLVNIGNSRAATRSYPLFSTAVKYNIILSFLHCHGNRR